MIRQQIASVPSSERGVRRILVGKGKLCARGTDLGVFGLSSAQSVSIARGELINLV